MPRPIWSGHISFGMIGIPIKLYTATEEKDVSFNQLHTVCKSRLTIKRWCPNCDREVPRDEIARGFQYEKDEYTIVEDEELEKLPLPSKHTIALAAFIPADELDPILHQRTYWIEPQEAGVKPYVLLCRALERKKRVGVATIAMRTHEELCAVRPCDGLLALDTLRYADEIRGAAKPKAPKVSVSDKELKMADSLIEMLEEELDLDKYEDHYREALMKLIESKVKKGKTVEPPAAPETTKVADLMEALRKSVEAAKKGGNKSKKKAA